MEKTFDIAFTLIDVMTVVPFETSAFEVGPREYLRHLLSLVTHLRNGESRFVALLHSKIRESLPSLAQSLQIPVAPTPPSNTLHDQPVYQESSTGSTASSPYGSPEATSHVLTAGSARFPPLLIHTSSHSDPTGMGLNIGSPLSSTSADTPSRQLHTSDGPMSYPVPFGSHPGSAPGAGAGSGYPN